MADIQLDILRSSAYVKQRSKKSNFQQMEITVQTYVRLRLLKTVLRFAIRSE
jgi:hypothetical protein